jgi:hypothetical protein
MMASAGKSNEYPRATSTSLRASGVILATAYPPFEHTACEAFCHATSKVFTWELANDVALRVCTSACTHVSIANTATV